MPTARLLPALIPEDANAKAVPADVYMGPGHNTQHGANLGIRTAGKYFADGGSMLQCSMAEEPFLFDPPGYFLLSACNQYKAILKNY